MKRCMSFVVLLAIIVWFVSPALSRGCPFCTMQGQTLTMEFNQAGLVLYGALENPRLNPNDALGGGTTDLHIETVVKSHAFIKDKKKVEIQKYLPVEKDSKIKFLVFCEIYKDRLDAYRGIPVKDDSIVTYLQGAAALKEKDIPARLEFFFGYLDHPDTNICDDAYREFANADAKDVEKMVQQMERSKVAAKLVAWLQDRDTPPFRYGLYGYLLGMCGVEKDAGVLVELLNDPQRGLVSNVDGVLAGYIALKPQQGWQYLRIMLGDPAKDFTRRYAALRTVRFLWDNPLADPKKELVPKKELLSAIYQLLDQSDMADFAIEDLRKWKQWDVADRILELYDKPSHNIPIIHRAILRYALSCPPENKKAAAFVAEQRRKDPEKVKDAEELLKLELPDKPPT